MGRHDSEDSKISRRKWLQSVTAGGVALVAGCSGGDGGDGTETGTNRNQPGMVTSTSTSDTETGTATDDSTPSGEVEMVDRPLRVTEGTPITEQNMNYFAAGFNMELSELSSIRLAQYSASWLGWVPLAAKHEHPDEVGPAPGTFDRENDEYRVQIFDGMTWSDGKKVTAQDMVMQAELEHLMLPKDARDPNKVITGWRADDETTLVFELNGDAGYNQRAVEFQALLTGVGFHLGPNMRVDSWYDGKRQELKDATTKSERDSIRTEVTQLAYFLPDAPESSEIDSVQMAGPYNPVSANQNEGVFETDPEHPIAKHNRINWSEARVKYPGREDPDRMASLFANNQVDMHHQVIPPSVSMAEHHKNVVNWEMGGIALAFNYGWSPGGGEGSAPNDPLHPLIKNDHRVRQAMAYVIDRPGVAQSAMQIAQAPVSTPAGLLDPQIKNEFPDLFSNLRKYERNQENVKKAEELMKAAGASRNNNGKWVDGDGNLIELTLMSIPDAEWTGANQGIVNFLKQFGFQVSSALPSNVQVGQRTANADFQMSLSEWGYGRPAKYFAYQAILDPSAITQQDPYYWTKHEFQAPSEIGNWDSELKTYNTLDIISGMNNVPLSESKEELKKLIWVTNASLPCIPILRDGSGMQQNTNTFKWPPRPDLHSEAHYNVVPPRPNQGWDQYPAVYGFEQETKDVRRGHWDSQWRGSMQARPPE